MTRFITLLAFLVTLVWVIAKPGFDSISACLAALVVLLVNEHNSSIRTKQKQIVKGNGIGIQSGGNTSINSSDKGKNSSDV